MRCIIRCGLHLLSDRAPRLGRPSFDLAPTSPNTFGEERVCGGGGENRTTHHVNQPARQHALHLWRSSDNGGLFAEANADCDGSQCSEGCRGKLSTNDETDPRACHLIETRPSFLTGSMRERAARNNIVGHQLIKQLKQVEKHCDGLGAELRDLGDQIELMADTVRETVPVVEYRPSYAQGLSTRMASPQKGLGVGCGSVPPASLDAAESGFSSSEPMRPALGVLGGQLGGSS